MKRVARGGRDYRRKGVPASAGAAVGSFGAAPAELAPHASSSGQHTVYSEINDPPITQVRHGRVWRGRRDWRRK
jgi:hypothetical protein